METIIVDDELFEIGDIVYDNGRTRFSGCSKCHQFGIVLKYLEKTNRYRVQLIGKTCGDSILIKNKKGNNMGTRTIVKPNPENRTTFLICSDGQSNKDGGYFFQKYNDDMNLVDWCDFGD